VIFAEQKTPLAAQGMKYSEILKLTEKKLGERTGHLIRKLPSCDMINPISDQKEFEMVETVTQKASIGCIVIYNHPGSKDGTFAPTQSPAIVRKAHEDGTVDLWVFGPKGIHVDQNLKEGNGPCCWSWPTRT